MKEANYKYRKCFADVVKSMDDRTAGKFTKAVNAYVFDNVVYSGNDPIIKTCFTLVKRALDVDKEDRENGKLGGKKSVEMRAERNEEKLDISKVIAGGIITEEILDSLFGCPCKSEKKKKEE